MNTFPVPTREQVSPTNQALSDALAQRIGFVPRRSSRCGAARSPLK